MNSHPLLLPVCLVALLAACCPPDAVRPDGAAGAAPDHSVSPGHSAAPDHGVAPASMAAAPMAGFSPAASATLDAFFLRTAAHKGRKVAVFDGDGTVFGQTPHYLADECLFAHAQAHPERNPAVIAEMKTQSNVSLPYVQNRIRYLAGLSLIEIRNLGMSCYRRDYKGKIYPPMKTLVGRLVAAGFEVWVVTASPEALYQGFLAEALDIPITRVIGVKSVVSGGKTTDRMVEPVPQDQGKLEAIETFVQARPLLVGGNSRGDKEMIEHSADLKLIVNPDEHVAPDQSESVASYAQKHGWLVVRIRDVPAPGFPAVSSKVFGMRLNKTRDVAAPKAP